MKKNVLFIVCALFLSLPVWAQEEVITEEVIVMQEEIREETCPTSSVIFDGSPYDFIFSWKKKAKESHWTGFGFAFSSLPGLTDVDLNLTRSYSIVFNLGDYIIPFNNNWLVATGLGFDWSRYHFNGNKALREIDGKVDFYTDSDNREYRDSKLRVYYATIPLLLEYQTKINSRHSFFVYGGVEGMVKLYSKSQIDIKMPQGSKKQKEDFRDLNLLPLNFRFTARVGVEDFSIFGYYQPYSMFKAGKGPELTPCGLGLMLNF